jgi:membrane-associated phospholipid phosphatase
VHARRHYWGDVIGGGIIGGLSGFLFTTPYQEMKKAKKLDSEDNLATKK